MSKKLPPDQGYKSRKLFMTLLALALISAGYLAAGKWAGLVVVFPEFVMGVLAAAASYLGANAATKYVAFRHGPKPEEPKAAEAVEAKVEDPRV